MLEQHINYLKKHDKYFINFWSSLTQKQKKKFIKMFHRIDKISNGELDDIYNEHEVASKILSKFYLTIPERDNLIPNIPIDWHSFVRNRKKKEDLFNFSFNILKQLFNKEIRKKRIFFYGNIKDDSSLIRKLNIIKISESSTKKKLLDLWDIVRFRIVVRKPVDIINISLKLWNEFFDEITRCRNYYFRPKFNDNKIPYKAIHFEIEITKNRIIEIQVISEPREGLIYFDHSLLFKKLLKFINNEHKDWLKILSLKTNIYESQCLNNSNY